MLSGGRILQCFLRMVCVCLPRCLRHTCILNSRVADKEKICVVGFACLVVLALSFVTVAFYLYEEPDMTKIDLSEKRQVALIRDYKRRRELGRQDYSRFLRTHHHDLNNENKDEQKLVKHDRVQAASFKRPKWPLSPVRILEDNEYPEEVIVEGDKNNKFIGNFHKRTVTDASDTAFKIRDSISSERQDYLRAHLQNVATNEPAIIMWDANAQQPDTTLGQSEYSWSPMEQSQINLPKQGRYHYIEPANARTREESFTGASSQRKKQPNLDDIPSFIHVYDLYPSVEDEFSCVNMATIPKTPICLYPNQLDAHVSYHIRKEGVWEGVIMHKYQGVLQKYSDSCVIDIGAHIGVYTLLAAKMGHDVIAIEPHFENIRHLQKAAQLGNVQHRITLLQNAVSDLRERVRLQIPIDNRGGISLDRLHTLSCTLHSCPPQVQTIYMDDIVEVTSCQTAILKVDIEGHEHHAFLHARKLLETIYVPYIFMEWKKMREYYGAEIDRSANKTLVHRLVIFLETIGYHAVAVISRDALKIRYWYGWPDDIMWIHEDAEEVFK